MSDFDSLFTAAQGLPEHERLRLINVLWDTVPPEAEALFPPSGSRKSSAAALNSMSEPPLWFLGPKSAKTHLIGSTMAKAINYVAGTELISTNHSIGRPNGALLRRSVSQPQSTKRSIESLANQVGFLR